MVAVFFSLLPMIIGSSIAPGVLSLNLVVLRGTKGVLHSAAFIIGAILLKMLQGLFFGYVFGAATAPLFRRGEESTLTSTLFMFMGLMFLIMGVRAYFRVPDPDAPPPKWMNMIEHLSAKKLFVFGIVWAFCSAKGWIFTLSALSIINDAKWGFVESALMYIIYVIGCMTFFILPLILCVAVPERANETITRLENWLKHNDRLVTMVVSALFGVVFLYRGLVGLLH